MKKKNIRAPEERNSFDDCIDEPEERLALVIEEPEYPEHPALSVSAEPSMYDCLYTLAIIYHYGSLVPDCTMPDFLIARKTIWKATEN